MTQIIARIPITVKLDVADTIETAPGRLVQAHGLLRNALLGQVLNGVTAAGSSDVEIAALDEPRLAVTWDKDPIDGDLQTWTTLGQRIDEREFRVEPSEGEGSTTAVLSLRRGINADWKTVGVISHPALAEAIGKAWCAGDLPLAASIDIS